MNNITFLVVEKTKSPGSDSSIKLSTFPIVGFSGAVLGKITPQKLIKDLRKTCCIVIKC